MAEYDEFDFDDEDTGSDLVKKLRKQVSELSKALKERDEQLTEFFAVTREQELAEALQEVGVSPKVASLVPDYVEDMDDLTQWLGEYGEVFGLSATKESGDSRPESVQAAELMSAVEEGGIDPSIGSSLESKIQNASTPEELAALLRG